jgi:hypothetical protein
LPDEVGDLVETDHTPGMGGEPRSGILNVATAPGQPQNSILKRRSMQATVNLGLVRRGNDSARRNDERGGGTNGGSELW